MIGLAALGTRLELDARSQAFNCEKQNNFQALIGVLHWIC
jgi:hypothetical protein